MNKISEKIVPLPVASADTDRRGQQHCTLWKVVIDLECLSYQYGRLLRRWFIVETRTLKYLVSIYGKRVTDIDD